MPSVRQQSNFSQLKAHDEQLERLGLLAECHFADDPNTCLLKLRQIPEAMAQSVASQVGLYTSSDERQIDLLRRLQDHGIVPREIGGLFHEIRKAGNDANHNLARPKPASRSSTACSKPSASGASCFWWIVRPSANRTAC